ncbi:MAG: hypothetical protein ACTSPB_07810 [Candidatus Thorarchaeota archaeon]
MIDKYEGDPKIFINENGPNLQINQGQPVMDQGLWNAVIISLFTKPNWAGNVLFTGPYEKIGSVFEYEAQQTISVDMLNKVNNAAQLALKWLTDNGSVDLVNTRVRNPAGHNIEVTIELIKDGIAILKMVATKNGVRWIVEEYI